MKQHGGIPCSPESLAEWEKAFKDIEESIKLVYKKGKECYIINNHNERS